MHAKPVQDLAGGKSILFGLLHPPITSRKNNNKYFVFNLSLLLLLPAAC
jgi:hypothetical protein